MYEDMRNFVVFRVPQGLWESHELDGAKLDDWIHENTIEGKSCVEFAESDFRHQYIVVGFSTEADAHVLRDWLRSRSFVDIAFD